MMSLPSTLSVLKTIDVQCTAYVEYERGMVSIPTGQFKRCGSDFIVRNQFSRVLVV